MNGITAEDLPAGVLEVLDVLEAAGKQAFVVGGFTRDVIRGAKPHDVDVTTDALWYQTRDVFISKGYRVLETGVKHGTVTVFAAGVPVEITTFRTDGMYSDHRRPDSVRFVRDVVEDLARRDFTINAIAYSPKRGLVDPFDGMSDIEHGIIRSVGNPDKRFTEDALRIIRGVRFVSKLCYSVDPETADAIHGRCGDLSLVAAERLATEYDGIVAGPGAVNALRSFPDVASQAVPPIRDMVGFEQHSKWHCYDVWEHCLHSLEYLDPTADRLVRHATLLHDIGKPYTFTLDYEGRGHFYGHEAEGARLARQVLTNLRWRVCDIDLVCCLIAYHDYRIDPKPKGVKRFLARLECAYPSLRGSAPELFAELLQVKRADALAHDKRGTVRRIEDLDQVQATVEEVLRECHVYSLKDLAVNGSDLLAAGMRPGPAVGRTLRHLLNRVIDGEMPNEREVLLASLDMNS